MEKTIRWFAAAFGLAFGATFGGFAAAAPGDLIYEAHNAPVEITAQAASQAGTWAVSNSIWDGAASDMTLLCVHRDGNKFFARATGLKTAAPANVPVTNDGVRIVGRVE